MSAATDDIFSDSILNRIHPLYLHCCLHHYYPNVIEVDSFYSIALFSNELVLVTKVRWFLHKGRVVKRVYWVELVDELPPYAVSETPTPFLPPLVPLPSSSTPFLLPIPISPPPVPSPPSTTSSHSSDTVVPGQSVPIGVISEEDESEWNEAHIPAKEEELEAHEIQLLCPYPFVDPRTLYDSPPETSIDSLD